MEDLFRLEIIDKNGICTKELTYEHYIEQANKVTKKERINLLEKAIYKGCKNLEIFFEVVRWLVDKEGNNLKAYSIAVLAPKSRKIPNKCKNPNIYNWEFDAYKALCAHYSGFDEEAFRIQKDLLYYNGEAYCAHNWLIQNYNFYLARIMKENNINTFINPKRKKDSKMVILFIGQYRTFDRTYWNILKNIIEPNNATVFVFCETDKGMKTLTQIMIDKWGEQTIGGCCAVKSRPSEFKHIENYLFKTKKSLHPDKFNASARPTYITSSGSILEYYYYTKCYDLMLLYEKKHNIKFDIIMRNRLDIITGSELHIQSFFEKINEVERENIGNDDIYMSHLGNGKMKGVMNTLNRKQIPNLLKELNSEKYVWTYGPNQIWIGKRSVMSQFYSLIYLYGKYDSGKESTFNSETQFDMFCKERNIHHFIINSENGSKYLCSRSLNQLLLKDPKDKIEEKNLNWTFIRMPWFYFPQN